MARSKGKTKLTNKEKLFVRYYIETWFNATEAARKAGYTDPTHAGYELRKKPQIENAISKYINGLIERSEDKVASVIRSLTIRAFYSVSDIINSEGKLIHSDLSKYGELQQVIDGIETKINASNIKTVVVKLANKDKASEMLGKYLKMFTDKVELTGKDGEPLPGINVTLPAGSFKK